MTDQQLVEAVATKVMGWKLLTSKNNGVRYMTVDGPARWWFPLTDWNGCWMVVERMMVIDHSHFQILATHDGWEVSFGNEKVNHDGDNDPRRAILLAALKAAESRLPTQAAKEASDGR